MKIKSAKKVPITVRGGIGCGEKFVAVKNGVRAREVAEGLRFA